jgi:hypothetical protein
LDTAYARLRRFHDVLRHSRRRRVDQATIELGYEDSMKKVFTGTVDMVEPGISGVVVTGYSMAAPLTRVRIHQVYEKQTAGAIVKDLAGRAGLKIKAIGFEINQPADPDQRVQVSDVRIVSLDAPGRQAHLQAQMDQLRAPLEIMGSNSPVAAYWRPTVNELNMAVIGLDPGAPLSEWRALVGRIDTLILASHKWSLADGRPQPYLVGTESEGLSSL